MIIDIAVQQVVTDYPFCDQCGVDIGYGNKAWLVACGYDHEFNAPLVKAICVECHKIPARDGHAWKAATPAKE